MRKINYSVQALALLLTLPSSAYAIDEGLSLHQLSGGSQYQNFGGLNIGGYLGEKSWELSAGLDQNFSFGKIKGSSSAIVVPSKEICINFGIGEKCWDTPEVTADTRSGVKVKGNIKGNAKIGADFKWQSGGVTTQLAAGLAGNVILPTRTFAYDSFKPKASINWRNDSVIDFTLPGVDFDPYIGLGLHFDGKIQGALPGLGISNIDLPTIDFDAPKIKLKDLPSFPTLPNFPEYIPPEFFGTSGSDAIASEKKIITATGIEIASLQRLQGLNPAFITEINKKKGAFNGLIGSLTDIQANLDASTLNQVKSLTTTLGGWVAAGEKNILPSNAFNLALTGADSRTEFLSKLTDGLGLAAAKAAGTEFEAKINSTKDQINTLFTDFKADIFTDNITVNSTISGNKIASKVRWDMLDFDMDLDGLVSQFSPVQTSIALEKKLGRLGNLLATFDVIDVKMGPKFGLESEFSVELTETDYQWESNETVLIKTNSGSNIGNKFTTSNLQNPTIQLLGKKPVDFKVTLDGVKVNSHFGLDLVISDLGTLEMAALADFELRFKSGLGKKINKVLPRWNDAVFAGKFPLFEFEFYLDLLDIDNSTKHTLNLALGSTTLTPSSRPVIPLYIETNLSSNSLTHDPNSGSFLIESTFNELNTASDPKGINHNGRPSVISDSLVSQTGTGFRVQFDSIYLNDRGDKQNLSAGFPVGPEDALWSEIIDDRQIVIGYRPFDQQSDEKVLLPMDFWIYGDSDNGNFVPTKFAGIKVIKGSHLRIEPVTFQTRDSRAGEHNESVTDTPFIENDGLISLIGEKLAGFTADLDNGPETFEDVTHEATIQGADDDGIVSLVIEGSGEIKMQGLAHLGNKDKHLETNILINAANHQISGAHSLTGINRTTRGFDDRARTRFTTYKIDPQGNAVLNQVTEAPTIYASALIANAGIILAKGHGVAHDNTDLIAYTQGILNNTGVLGSEGGNLAAYAKEIISSGEVRADGGRVDLTKIIKPSDDILKRSEKFTNSGLISAFNKGVVAADTGQFKNTGILETKSGGTIRIAGDKTILGAGSSMVSDGAGSKIDILHSADTEGTGYIGFNAYADGHIRLNGINQSPDASVSALFDIDGGTLELASGNYNTPNYLLRSTGSIDLGENVNITLTALPDAVTVVAEKTIVDLNLGQSLHISKGSHFGLDLLNRSSGNSLGDDMVIRNHTELTVLEGTATTSFLSKVTQQAGDLQLLSGANLQTDSDLTVRSAANVLVDGAGSSLSIAGNLDLENGTSVDISKGAHLAIMGATQITGAQLIIESSSSLNHWNNEVLTGDWTINEVLENDGSHTAARLQLPGNVKQIEGTLSINGANASVSGLSSLTRNNGQLILSAGATVNTASSFTGNAQSLVDLDAARLVTLKRYSMANTHLSRKAVLETEHAIIGQSLTLNGGQVIADQISVNKEALVSGNGSLTGIVKLKGRLTPNLDNAFGKIIVNGQLNLPNLSDSEAQANIAIVQSEVLNNAIEIPGFGSANTGTIGLNIGGYNAGEFDSLEVNGLLLLSGGLDGNKIIPSTDPQGSYSSILDLIFTDSFTVISDQYILGLEINPFGNAEPGDDNYFDGQRTGYFDQVNVTWLGNTTSYTDMILDDYLVNIGQFSGFDLALAYNGGDGNDIAFRFTPAPVPLPGSLQLFISALLLMRLRRKHNS